MAFLFLQSKKTRKNEYLGDFQTLPGDIFQRYSSYPVFTNDSWAGFQSSLEYWQDRGERTILITDEKFEVAFLELFDECHSSVQNLPKEMFRTSVFFIRFTHDQDALSEIAQIIGHGGRFVSSADST